MRFFFTFTFLTLVCAATATLRPFLGASRRDASSDGSVYQEADAAGEQQAGNRGQQQERAYLGQTVLRRNLLPNGSSHASELKEQRRRGETDLVTQENGPFYAAWNDTVPLLHAKRGPDFTRRALRPIFKIPLTTGRPDADTDMVINFARRDILPNGYPLTAEERRDLPDANQELGPFYVPFNVKMPLTRANRGLDFTRRALRPSVIPLGADIDRDFGFTRRGIPSSGGPFLSHMGRQALADMRIRTLRRL
ncbi:unnamed protein product [Peniophora sp. CBMAI 1063]|nr:unnamed protein product [Peniophora sp. CBMAI 1063]